MSFLKRIFKPADPLVTMRRYFEQERWADALAVAEDGAPEGSDPAVQEEFARMARVAGDRLAAINLDEAEACLRVGERQRARDHLDLARDQASSPELAERLERLLDELAAPLENAKTTAPGAGCGSGCSAGSGPAETVADGDGELDLETRLELCLGGYPAALVDSYRDRTPAFRRAVVRVHAGGEGAEAALEELGPEERDEHFFFERGALFARNGRGREALADLREALALAPGHPMAGDLLLTLLLQGGDLDAAEELLQGMEKGGYPAAFCQARRMTIAALQGDTPKALKLGRSARELGFGEPDFILTLAALEERVGRLDQAESLLCGLAAGGCGGGVPLPLAEFWLRHRQELDKALEAFKKAWRQEPENPRWPLRTAQVYLARGWNQEGRRLLEEVLASPGVDEELRLEAEESLKQS